MGAAVEHDRIGTTLWIFDLGFEKRVFARIALETLADDPDDVRSSRHLAVAEPVQ
jgi:hypothetical protein